MRVSQLADRYAKALYELAAQAGRQDQVLNEMRSLQELFAKDETILEFFRSPMFKAPEKEKLLAKAFNGAGLSSESASFVLLLAQKGRLGVFDQIVEALKLHSDQAHGVTRGSVQSAVVLSPEERKRIEDIVSRFTKKQVILNYKEDASVIGGLIAQVGSYTFDDTLTSHLRRLKDEINRRSH